MARPAIVFVMSALCALTLCPSAGADPDDGAAPSGEQSACSYQAPTGPLTPDPTLTAEVRPAVEGWFTLINPHADIEQVLPRLDLDDFVVAFPGESYCTEAGVRDWYAEKASVYHDQTHKIVSLVAGGDPQRPVAHVTVLWSATNAQTGEVFRNIRVEQVWQFRRVPNGAYTITRYLNGPAVATEPARTNPDWPPAPIDPDLREDPELTAQVRPFADAWFDCASHCTAQEVDKRFSFLQFPIEYIGPTGTFRTEAQERADFLKARPQTNMVHEILTFAAGGDPDAPVADITLRFAADEPTTHQHVAHLIHQQWQLVREGDSYRITKYYILAMDPA